MNAEIIGTGSELLLGQIANTDAQFISQQLSSIGINVFYHTVIGDNKERILDSLAIASKRSDLIITTGGLGPTMDDLSKETVAEHLGLNLILHEESKERIQNFFSYRNKKMSDINLKQAMFPAEAIVLPNNNGTAPGAIMEKDDKIYIVLPGPPYELQPMFLDSVLPYLQDKNNEKIISRVLKIFGIGESSVEEKVKDLLVNQNNPTIAPLASYGEVTLRITAKASDGDSCQNLIKPLEDEIVMRLGNCVYGYDEDQLESVVVSLLKEKGLKLAIAESCTGGHISNLITNITGCSDVFLEGCVTYSNKAKSARLGVLDKTIQDYGAVSEETAIEMAKGIISTSRADIGLSITGIAGPTGGTVDKPVGLVYISLCHMKNINTEKHLLTGTRQGIKHQISCIALNMLRLYLLEK